METTTGTTYKNPNVYGPVEPLKRDFYKTQRWNVIQKTELGIYKLLFINFIYRKKWQT